MCGRLRHSLQNFRYERHNGKFTAAVGSESASEFRKDPDGTKFLTSSRLFVRPFVPVADENVGRRPNCVTLARMSRRESRKFERARPGEGEGRKGGGDDENGVQGDVWSPLRIWRAVRVLDGSASKWGSLMYMHAIPGQRGMARITINMLDSRLTAVVLVPFPPSRHPRRSLLVRSIPFDLADVVVDSWPSALSQHRYANVLLRPFVFALWRFRYGKGVRAAESIYTFFTISSYSSFLPLLLLSWSLHKGIFVKEQLRLLLPDEMTWNVHETLKLSKEFMRKPSISSFLNINIYLYNVCDTNIYKLKIK